VKKHEGEISFFDGKFQGAPQYKQVQDAITSGRYNIFVVMPNDQAGIVPVIRQAISKGIKVGALQFPIGKDPTKATPQVPGVVSSVIEDVVKGAQITGDGIVKACGNKNPCKVGIIWGARTVTWEAAKQKPLLAILNKHKNIKVVGQADGGFLQGPGQKATDDFLQANPDLDVIATPSGDQMIRGAERAVTRAGKTYGLGANDVKLVGYGASIYAVKRVREGKWVHTYSLVPQTMSRILVQRLVDSLNGKKVNPGTGQWDLNPIGAVVNTASLKRVPSFKGEWDG
jgi:ribose transport system substrate-binding protein